MGPQLPLDLVFDGVETSTKLTATVPALSQCTRKMFQNIYGTRQAVWAVLLNAGLHFFSVPHCSFT